MPELPNYIKAHMNESILGRAKLKLYESVSERKHWIPEDVEVRKFIRAEFRKNPAAGKIILALLTKNSLNRAIFSELIRPSEVLPLLNRLEHEPLSAQIVLQISECPDPLPSVLGVCINNDELADGVVVYGLTLFDDDSFPKAFSGHIEIRASSGKPEPMFGVLSSSGFEHYDEKTFDNSWYADLAIRVLAFLDRNRPVNLVPLSQINQVEFREDEVHRPPEDSELTERIASVINGELACTLTTVPLETIKPFSLDFCLTYPKETVNFEIKEIRHGDAGPLIVYWHVDHFVMSDDYSAYLAHRFLKSETVPVAIVGEFPEHIAIGEQTVGGSELIPPLRIMESDNYDSLTPEIKEWLIDTRLRRRETSGVASKLAAVAMVLSEILSEASTDEKLVHKFLAQNPIVIDPHGSALFSELRLGKTYRVDLAIQYNLDEKRLMLIELEHPNVSLFTAKGRPRSHVTHALQQVEDWLQWWREHPEEVPKELDPTIPVEGLVVIGRNNNLTEQDKRRLLHLNSTRQVKLITYDELLDKLEVLIQHLESQ